MVIMVEECDFSDSSQELKNPQKATVQGNPGFSERPPKLSVSFKPMTLIYDIPTLDDYTAEEIKDSWYTAEEVQQIREDIKADVVLLEAGQLVESRQRGLECRTKKGMRRKFYFREKAYEAVFSEIEFQHEEGFLDEVTIAEAYHFSCKSATMLGQKQGRKDAREAMRINRTSLKDRGLVRQAKMKKLTVQTSIAAV